MSANGGAKRLNDARRESRQNRFQSIGYGLLNIFKNNPLDQVQVLVLCGTANMASRSVNHCFEYSQLRYSSKYGPPMVK